MLSVFTTGAIMLSAMVPFKTNYKDGKIKLCKLKIILFVSPRDCAQSRVLKGHKSSTRLMVDLEVLDLG
jgi:hypothetical protein